MAWIEVHQSLPTHWKTEQAADELDIKPVHMVGHLTLLWLWALDNAPDGHLKASARAIARRVDWDGDPDAFVLALVNADLLYQDEDGLHIHDWMDYAGRLLEKRRSDADRLRRWRAAQRNETEAVATRDSDETRTNGVSYDVPKQTVPNRTQPNSTGPNPTREENGARASTNGTATAVATRPSRPKAAQPQPPPEELRAFHVVLDGLPGYVPTAAFFDKVLTKYSALDLDEQAIKMADWLRRKPDRKCSAAFITNWLGDELEKLEARSHERERRHAGPGRSVLAHAAAAPCERPPSPFDVFGKR